MAKDKSKQRDLTSAVKSDSSYIETEKFVGCDTCSRGIVTKDGVICGDSLALVCKPGLLEMPKHYIDWESEIENESKNND